MGICACERGGGMGSVRGEHYVCVMCVDVCVCCMCMHV